MQTKMYIIFRLHGHDPNMHVNTPSSDSVISGHRVQLWKEILGLLYNLLVNI